MVNAHCFLRGFLVVRFSALILGIVELSRMEVLMVWVSSLFYLVVIGSGLGKACFALLQHDFIKLLKTLIKIHFLHFLPFLLLNLLFNLFLFLSSPSSPSAILLYNSAAP